MSYPVKRSWFSGRAITAACAINFWSSVQAQVVATSDFYYAREGTALVVSAPGVLANDSGLGLTATLVNRPAHGTLSLNGNGSFTYTPTNNFTGMDGFTYRASNSSHTSGIASVNLMVVAPGALFYDDFSRPTNGSTIFPWTTVSNTSGSFPVSGAWVVANNLLIGNGPFYTYGYACFNTNWTDYSVQAQMRFSANNAASAGLLGRLNASTSAHYDVWIYPEASTEPLGSGNGTAILRLFKHEGWTTYTEIGNPAVLPGVGVDWHTVKLTFKGANISAYFDSILTLSAVDNGSIDGKPALTSGGVGLNMWTAPPAAYAFSVDNVIVSTTNAIANYDSYNAVTNTSLQVPAPGILANDAAPGLLTAMLVSGAAHGVLTLTNNGGFSYTPTNGFSGTDSFTYRCSDGQTTSTVATVVIVVNNSAFANDNAYGMSANKILNVGAPGVLANAWGGAGPLTAILDTGPADGSLTLSNSGGFNYTPANGFLGVDSFTYQCRDNQSTSRVAVAAINVVTQEPPPVMLSLGLTNNNVSVTWSSAANLIYQLQSCDSLSGTGWANVQPPVTANGLTTTETNATSNAFQQFYRVILLTP